MADAGKTLPTSYPGVPAVPPSNPDGRNRQSDGQGDMKNSPSGAKVDQSMADRFREGLISGGKGQSVADAAGPLKKSID